MNAIGKRSKTETLSMKLGLAGVLICILAAGDAKAAGLARDPIVGRGFAANQVFQVNDVDSVNQLNGNLVVTIPIGQTFATNGTLKYQFMLTYNSNIWDYRAFGVPGFSGVNWIEVTGGSHHYDLFAFVSTVYGGADLDTSYSGGSESYPAKSNNVGIGWMLTLGELKKTLTYLSPDGSEHQFWPNEATGSALDATVLYTRDGSYLRMRRRSPTIREVDTPDGLRRRFICVDRCSTVDEEVWALDQIADPYGNVLYVERTRDGRPAPIRPTTPGEWKWTFIEAWTTKNDYADHVADVARASQETRRHTLTFGISAARPWELRLERAELAGFGGASAAYSFLYNESDIYRDRASIWAGEGLLVPFNTNMKIDVSLLDRVEIPETAGSGHNTRWRFRYMDSPQDLKEIGINGRRYQTSHMSGRLTGLFYPTGGGVVYEYGPRLVPAKSCGSKPQEGLALTTAVATRQLVTSDFDAATGLPKPDGEPWRYFGAAYESSPVCTGHGAHGLKELQSTTVDPLGNATVTFFSVYTPQTAADDAPWTGSDWGLPLSKAETDQGRYLSTAVFQCTDLTLFQPASSETVRNNVRRIVDRNLLPGEILTCGPAIRKTFVSYEQDEACGGPGADTADCFQTNRRLRGRHVRYLDDGNAYVATDYSDFDGYGNYRKAVTSGNFASLNSPGQVELRTEVKNYNADRTLTENDPWVTGTFTETRLEEGTAVERQLHVFDARGFLLRRRTLARTDGMLAKNDILETFERAVGQDGSVTVTERSFGGDQATQALCTSCALATQELPQASDYRVDARYRYGMPESRAFVDPCSGVALLTLGEAVLDPSTGFPVTVRDGSGAGTRYDYDSLGRITREAPDGLAATQYSYATYDAALLPGDATSGISCGEGYGLDGRCGGSVTISRLSDRETLAQRELVYDHVGRIRAERELLPAGWNERRTYYLANGWKDSVRTPVQKGGSNPWGTVFSDYDPFGRAHTVTNADGTKLRLQYAGDRYMRRYSLSDGSVDVEEKRDSFGRLAVVGERSNCASAPPAPCATDRIATRYGYDVGGRLASVTTAGQPTRLFDHDGRGFAISDRHPELGIAGNGREYRQFDSQGNVLVRSLVPPGSGQPASAFDLRFDYDRAGRIVAVSQLGVQENGVARRLKELTYYTDNQNPFHPAESAGLAKGKVFQSTRHNWVPDPAAVANEIDIPVTETHFYLGPQGLLSRRRTNVSGGFPSTSQTFFYNALGRVASVGYPVCVGPCAGVAPARTVTFGYKSGRLTSVPGFASDAADGIQYSFNGAVKKVRHDNGVIETWSEDPYHLNRPSRINVGSLWTSGDYEYDTAGNITAIGPGVSYSYDSVGRIRTAGVGGRTQAYTYDIFGNLLTIGGLSNGVDGQNNRRTTSTYDAAGNVTAENGFTYTYDGLSKLRSLDGGPVGKEFVYTAEDERVGVIDFKAAKQVWSFRGLNHEVLRDYVKNGLDWTWKDYVYREGTLLANVSPAGTVHFHPDHLGSPRVISDAQGAAKALHTYLPFGEELNADQDAERMKFTGHERDENRPGSQVGDLDYMHQRYYSATTGRFLSVDPVGGQSVRPQTWNRYGYTMNNPVGMVDLDGRKGWAVVKNVALGILDTAVDAASSMVGLPFQKPFVLQAAELIAGSVKSYGTTGGRADLAKNWRSTDDGEKVRVVAHAVTTAILLEEGGRNLMRASTGVATNRAIFSGAGKDAAASAGRNLLNDSAAGAVCEALDRAGLPGWLTGKAWGMASRLWGSTAQGTVHGYFPEGVGTFAGAHEIPAVNANPKANLVVH